MKITVDRWLFTHNEYHDSIKCPVKHIPIIYLLIAYRFGHKSVGRENCLHTFYLLIATVCQNQFLASSVLIMYVTWLIHN